MKNNNRIEIFLVDIVECESKKNISREQYDNYYKNEIDCLEANGMDFADALLQARFSLEEKGIAIGIQVADYPGPIEFKKKVIRQNVLLIEYKGKLIDFEKLNQENVVEEITFHFLYSPNAYPNPLPGFMYIDKKHSFYAGQTIEKEEQLVSLTNCSYDEIKALSLKKIRRAKLSSFFKKKETAKN